MSMEAYKWAKTFGKRSGLKGPEKAVLLWICDYYNEEQHRAWPSIERLANDTCYNRTTVMRAIRSLEDHGLVVSEPWRNASTGAPLTTRYCLPLHDDLSVPADNIPVLAYKEFDHTGKLRYDTFPQFVEHGERVPAA